MAIDSMILKNTACILFIHFIFAQRRKRLVQFPHASKFYTVTALGQVVQTWVNLTLEQLVYKFENIFFAIWSWISIATGVFFPEVLKQTDVQKYINYNSRLNFDRG
jgi:hypothetical protein